MACPRYPLELAQQFLEFINRDQLDLADAFARDSKTLPDLLERLWFAVVEPEAGDQNSALPRAQERECLAQDLTVI